MDNTHFQAAMTGLGYGILVLLIFGWLMIFANQSADCPQNDIVGYTANGQALCLVGAKIENSSW